VRRAVECHWKEYLAIGIGDGFLTLADMLRSIERWPAVLESPSFLRRKIIFEFRRLARDGGGT
jgi:hypothetical protein